MGRCLRLVHIQKRDLRILKIDDRCCGDLECFQSHRPIQSCGVTTAAMDTTGVYWIPALEILEAHGFEVILVNA